MKNAFIGLAFLLAGATAFAVGEVSAARGAGEDLSGVVGHDSKTGLAYLRVLVVNSSETQVQGPNGSMAAERSRHKVTLAEGSSIPITGTLRSASAVEKPCDLIVFEKGQSQIILTSPSGTALKDMRVDGTVSASGNPLGYSCSIVLEYTIP